MPGGTLNQLCLESESAGRPVPPAQAGSSLVLEACDVSSSSGNGVGVEGATLQLKDSQVHNCERHGVAAFGGFEGERRARLDAAGAPRGAFHAALL
jgi:hypothetical protein